MDAESQHSVEAGLISQSSIVVAKPDVASCELGSGFALLDLEQSQYFSMNAVAAEIWGRIQSPATVAELVQLVRDTFEIADADVAADIQSLLAELDRLRLINVSQA